MMWEHDVKPGRECWIIKHEYDDEFGFHEIEVTDICENENAAERILTQQKELGLDNNESYWKEKWTMWR